MKKATSAALLFLLAAGLFMVGSWYGQRGNVKAATSGARKILYYVDPMHPAYKSDKPGIAPDCGMELVPVYEDGSMGGAGGGASAGPPGTVNVSPEKQQLIGVRVSPVEKIAGTHTLRILGRVVPDEARLYKLVAGIDGFIQEVSAPTTGSQVKKDQLLATFSAPNATSFIQTYILNVGAEQRLTKAVAESSIEGQALPAANWNVQQRTQQLQNVGISLLQLEEIKRTHRIPERIRIISPVDGFVLARNVSPDLKFDRGAEWYRIADLTRVWILADVFEDEAKYLRPGLTVTVSLPQRKRTFPAKVSAVRPQFDPATRTLKVRLEADNPGYVLRPDMFVDVELSISLPPAICVPVDAVIDSGLTQTVFVDRGQGIFEPRQVETGWRLGERVEVVKGLKEGERVVSAGTFLLDSESRMRLAATTTGGAGTPLGHDHRTHDHGAHAVKAMGVSPVAQAFAGALDPVCGMEVDAGKAKIAGRVSEYGERTYYFCSEDCKRKFDMDPPRYALGAAPESGMGAAHTGEEHGSHEHGGHDHGSHAHGGHQ